MSAHEKSQAAELRAVAVEWGMRGFRMGYNLGSRGGILPSHNAHRAEKDLEEEAARRFADPAEPRVVADPHGTTLYWRFLPYDISAGGDLEYMTATSAWTPVDGDDAARWKHTPQRVALWMDLMAYPFERDGQKRETAA